MAAATTRTFARRRALWSPRRQRRRSARTLSATAVRRRQYRHPGIAPRVPHAESLQPGGHPESRAPDL